MMDHLAWNCPVLGRFLFVGFALQSRMSWQICLSSTHNEVVAYNCQIILGRYLDQPWSSIRNYWRNPAWLRLDWTTSETSCHWFDVHSQHQRINIIHHFSYFGLFLGYATVTFHRHFVQWMNTCHMLTKLTWCKCQILENGRQQIWTFSTSFGQFLLLIFACQKQHQLDKGENTLSVGPTVFRGLRNLEPSRGICHLPRNFNIFVEFEKCPVISTIIGVMSDDWLISHSFQSTHVMHGSWVSLHFWKEQKRFSFSVANVT